MPGRSALSGEAAALVARPGMAGAGQSRFRLRLRATWRAIARAGAAIAVAGVVAGAGVMLDPSAAVAASVPPGRIAYTVVSPDSSEWQVRIVNPDGTGARKVYSCSVASCELMLSFQAWDPAGRRVAVEEATRVACPGDPPAHTGDPWGPPHWDQYGCLSDPVTYKVIDVDTGAVRTLAPTGAGGPVGPPPAYGASKDMPFWSPDGRLIAFDQAHRLDPSDPNYVVDAYVVDVNGGSQVAVQIHGSVAGWTPSGQLIVYNNIGLRKVDPSTGADVGLFALGFSRWASVSPDGQLTAIDHLQFFDNSFATFTLDAVPPSDVPSVTWSPDSTEVAYTRGLGPACCLPSLPGVQPLVARAPFPGSPMRTVVAGERVVGYPSWSPAPEPTVKIDTPVDGQEFTGHESTPAEQDAVRLTGSVSSHTAISGWCVAVQPESKPAPAPPAKTDCNRPFDSTSVTAGKTTSRFKTDLKPLLAKDLEPGKFTIWVWGYDTEATPKEAKLTVTVRPNYYIKHIEVAQAISAPLTMDESIDPFKVDPYVISWHVPSVAGFPIPLIAGRSTLLRVYVGDSSLAAGKSADATIRYAVSVVGNTSEGDATVVTTAPDLQPNQDNRNAAIMIRIPGAETATDATLSADVSINSGQADPECQGCYPNGNRAAISGIAAEPGGDITLTPVPINIISPTGKIDQPVSGYADVWPFVGDYLPVREDGGVNLAKSPFTVVASQAELDKLAKTNAACPYLLDQIALLRAASTPPPIERWVGVAPQRQGSTARGCRRCLGARSS